jgi:hypothetical protein
MSLPVVVDVSNHIQGEGADRCNASQAVFLFKLFWLGIWAMDMGSCDVMISSSCCHVGIFDTFKYYHSQASLQRRPYHDDSTASRLLSEVKHRRAWSVLRWGTTLESRVLSFIIFLLFLTHHSSSKIQDPRQKVHENHNISNIISS